MRQPNLSVLVAAIAASLLAIAASRPAPRRAAHAGDSPSVARLSADIEYLADDLLEGRGTGTRGYDLAARYAAAQFEAAGIAPAGDIGYLQAVPFRRAELLEPDCRFEVTLGGRSTMLGIATDVMPSAGLVRARESTDAPLVYAGFGVHAPELGHDDFAGLDVRGKIMVVLRGAPAKFPHNERAYHSNSLVKEQAAAERGALGMVTFLTPEDEKRQTWDRTVRQSRLPALRWREPGGAVANVQPAFQVGGQLSRAGAEKVFAGAPRTLTQAFAAAESGRAGGFDLPGRLRATRSAQLADVSSPNVLGVLRGTDPRLREECVVLTAHLDHLGISSPVDGDSINNGWMDNATGSAMVLEAARIMAAGARPRRSIVFALVTGEEKGLQGSDFLARHPLPGGLRPIANVNLDMLLVLFPLRRTVLYGAEHSTLGPVAERLARANGLEPTADPHPEETIFVRSDQFSFVKQGVPAIYPVGVAATDAERAAEQTWRRTIYHSPQDGRGQQADLPSAARFTAFAAALARDVANAPLPPVWNPGDTFGKRFGRPR